MINSTIKRSSSITSVDTVRAENDMLKKEIEGLRLERDKLDAEYRLYKSLMAELASDIARAVETVLNETRSPKPAS